MITQLQLQKLFSYDPVTGIVIRKITVNPNGQKGTIVGTLDNGYLRVNVEGRKYQLHRIIWFMVYGYFPENIDHINRIRNDNCLCNLRAVSNNVNQRNKQLNTNNTSGIIGVSWDKTRKKWEAHIGDKGTKKHLGRFTTKTLAIQARAKASKTLNYHPNHGIDI